MKSIRYVIWSVIAVFVLLAVTVVTVPLLTKSRTVVSGCACQNTLRQIYSAQQIAVEIYGWSPDTNWDEPDYRAVVNTHIRGGERRCPKGGIYRYRKISQMPTCSYYDPNNPDSVSHRLDVVNFAGRPAPAEPSGTTMRTVQEFFGKPEIVDGQIERDDDARVPNTGQTVSHRTGDDANLQTGVAWPAPRFTDHGDGTVTDNLTELMWTKNTSLPGCTLNWNDAIDYCNNMNSGTGTYGYTDWRLPNVRELQSLFDYGRYNPALPSGHPFTGVRSGYYWSSSSIAADSSAAWAGIMHDGLVKANHKSARFYVWSIRGGQ